jgi:hypothetical protein
MFLRVNGIMVPKDIFQYFSPAPVIFPSLWLYYSLCFDFKHLFSPHTGIATVCLLGIYSAT